MNKTVIRDFWLARKHGCRVPTGFQWARLHTWHWLGGMFSDGGNECRRWVYSCWSTVHRFFGTGCCGDGVCWWIWDSSQKLTWSMIDLHGWYLLPCGWVWPYQKGALHWSVNASTCKFADLVGPICYECVKYSQQPFNLLDVKLVSVLHELGYIAEIGSYSSPCDLDIRRWKWPFILIHNYQHKFSILHFAT